MASKVPGKHDGWKKAGLIGLGTVLGVLLSLNFSAVAQREAKTPIPYEDLQLLSAVFGKIKSDYVETVPDDKLIKEAINGMVRGLDPHSDFLDADAFKELQVSTQGKFGGLGIEVGVEDGVVRVTSPIEDTPAFRAGIKAGDLIVKIDDTATRGLPLSKAVEKMRGKPGTHGGADHRAQGRRDSADVHADARGNQRQERAREDAGAGLRLHPHPQLPGAHRRGPRQGAEGLLREGRTEGPRARRAQRPGRPAQPGGRGVRGLPAQGCARRLHRRTHARRAHAPVRQQGQLLAPRRRLLQGPAARGEEGADGGAGRRRHGVGVRDRRRRAAGSQARHGASATRRSARARCRRFCPLGNNAGLKLTTARYYTPSGRSIQAKGIEPDINVDDGSDTTNRIREANLERHLETSKTAAAKEDEAKAHAAAQAALKPGEANKAEVAAKLPRFEFGAADDFQLQQAMNHLKGQPVITSTKAMATANSAVPAQAKP